MRSSMSTDRRLIVGVALAAAATLSACTIPTNADIPKAEIVTEIVVAPPEETSTVPAPLDGVGPLAGFSILSDTLDGAVGIALVPVGGGQSLVAGEWHSGAAWSTIKVPIAMAALANLTALHNSMP